MSSPATTNTFTSKPAAKKASKSVMALHREQVALRAFDSFRAAQGFTPPIKISVTLLPPSHHLTQACWSTFHKHVRTYPGWTAQRRKATPEEKLACKETRKAPVYWVDIHYCPLRAYQKIADIRRQQPTMATTTLMSAAAAPMPPAAVTPKSSEPSAAPKKEVLEDISNDASRDVTP